MKNIYKRLASALLFTLLLVPTTSMANTVSPSTNAQIESILTTYQNILYTFGEQNRDNPQFMLMLAHIGETLKKLQDSLDAQEENPYFAKYPDYISGGISSYSNFSNSWFSFGRDAVINSVEIMPYYRGTAYVYATATNGKSMRMKAVHKGSDKHVFSFTYYDKNGKVIEFQKSPEVREKEVIEAMEDDLGIFDAGFFVSFLITNSDHYHSKTKFNSAGISLGGDTCFGADTDRFDKLLIKLAAKNGVQFVSPTDDNPVTTYRHITYTEVVDTGESTKSECSTQTSHFSVWDPFAP